MTGGLTLGGERGKVTLPGLTTILAIFAGFVLLFTGKYPESISRLRMGMNRWTYRAGAYAGLMTDKYPPFSLD